MADEYISGKALIVLNLPDGGIPRSPGSGGGIPGDKSDSEIINEIVAQAVATTNWVSAGVKKPADIAIFPLEYEAS